MSTFLTSCKTLIRSFVGTSSSPKMPAEMDVDAPPKSGLFAACSFVIVRHGEFDDKQAQEVCDVPV